RHTSFSRDWSSDVCSSDLLSTTIGSGTAMKLGDSAVNNRTLSAPGLPVLLQKEATQEVVVQGTIDPSLVAVYDSLNHTKSPEFRSEERRVGKKTIYQRSAQ